MSGWLKNSLRLALSGLPLVLGGAPSIETVNVVKVEAIPQLASIPAAFQGEERAKFVQRRQQLQAQQAALRDACDTFSSEPASRQNAGELAKIEAMRKSYVSAADAFNADLRADEEDAAPVINGLRALATNLRWSATKQARLDSALNRLDRAAAHGADELEVNRTWEAVRARGDDAELRREASQGGGLGPPGAGRQNGFNDCAVFALANATGVSYGLVAASAAELIRRAGWRRPYEQADPEKTIKGSGLNGGEVIMLAEFFGRAEVVPSSDFPRIMDEGVPIMVNLDVSRGHEVVLTKTFSHRGETWYVMMDSGQNPDERRFVSARELDVLLKENGVICHPEPGSTPAVLGSGGNP